MVSELIAKYLPIAMWGICGIVLVAFSFNKRKKENPGIKASDTNMYFGMCVGMTLGAFADAFGIFTADNAGIVIGMLWGMGIGLLFENFFRKK